MYSNEVKKKKKEKEEIQICDQRHESKQKLSNKVRGRPTSNSVVGRIMSPHPEISVLTPRICECVGYRAKGN